MRKVFIIGIDSGDPDYLTVQAINALNQVDVFFIPDKGSEKAGLKQLRMEICDRFIKNQVYRLVELKTPERAKEFSSYQSNVAEWHARIEAIYVDLLMKRQHS